MELSHHSSNPLEVGTSDPVNARYKSVLKKAQNQRDPASLLTSSEAGNLEYQEHINETMGTIIHALKPDACEVTPKAGGLDSGVIARKARKFAEMIASDDEIALVDNDRSTPEMRAIVKAEFVETHNILVESISDDYVEDIKVDEEWDQPEGDFFDGEHFPDFEDEEMRSAGGNSRCESRLGSLSPLTPLSSNHSSPYSSPQSSRPPSPDEMQTLSLRPSDEQEDITDEIEQLYESVPELENQYLLVDRLGTGTFSSVYKAVDLLYDESYNEPWLGHHPPESSAYYQSAGPAYKGRGGRAARLKEGTDAPKEDNGPGRVFVAVKRIYTTSGPDRIRNELSILEDCRGCRHSSQIITAFRNEDQVVIVLPYQRNMDFREFYQTLHPEGIKCYFRCLFRALRDIHARGIIHRDVKPANFLYDPFTGIGTLCDFGLASRMESRSRIQQLGKCYHEPASPSDPHGKNKDVDPSESDYVKQAQREARAKSNSAADKVGYPEQDRRPTSKANRAGTRGFRAPEVLLKCGAQTGAVDVWSAGVILLFFLTGKFPIFQSNDDVEGLMELALIMGKRNMERVATLHGRTFASNIPDLDQDGISWTQFVERLNPDIHTPKKYDMRFYPHNSKHRDGRGSRRNEPPPSSSPTSISTVEMTDPFTDGGERAQKNSDRYANPPTAERYSHFLKFAFHLLEQVLHFESTKRYTPRKVLYHKFLDEAGVDGDDEFVPHVVGEGVCGKLHYHDRERGDAHFVQIPRRCKCKSLDSETHNPEDGWDDDDGEDGHIVVEELELEAGQGIPIGRHPCEYHQDLDLSSLE